MRHLNKSTNNLGLCVNENSSCRLAFLVVPQNIYQQMSSKMNYIWPALIGECHSILWLECVHHVRHERNSSKEKDMVGRGTAALLSSLKLEEYFYCKKGWNCGPTTVLVVSENYPWSNGMHVALVIKICLFAGHPRALGGDLD